MALYNEYRPKTLEEIRGQDVIKTQLKAMFMSGNIPNALLFSGPRGTGKTTIARIVARFVNCKSPNGDPCNECESCKEILAGSSVDVKEIDAASNNKVEDVHKIIEDAQYAPLGNKKVYILDEAHMLTTAAWNSLLKILEEPPANTLFILCTTEENKVPATIVSRCRKLFFERVDLNEIVDLMEDICEERGCAYDKDALVLISRASEGCVRDALSILESFLTVDAVVTENVARTLGLTGEDVIFSILRGIVEGNAKQAVDSLHVATSRGINLPLLVKSLIGAVSDALFIKQGADVKSVLNTVLYKEQLAQFAPMLQEDRALELISALTEIYGGIGRSTDAGFLVEASLLKTCKYEGELEKLKARVEALEKAVAEGSVVTASMQEAAAGAQGSAKAESGEAVSSETETAGDGFMPCDDDPPFAEDEDSIYFDVNQVFEAAAPVTANEEVKKEEPAPQSTTSPIQGKGFVPLSSGVEFGESESLFDTSDDGSVGKSAEKSSPMPESEAFIKVAPIAPEMNGPALSGFLWQ
jgi:DNA polymerase-3 subunit gamma/tau